MANKKSPRFRPVARAGAFCVPPGAGPKTIALVSRVAEWRLQAQEWDQRNPSRSGLCHD